MLYISIMAKNGKRFFLGLFRSGVVGLRCVPVLIDGEFITGDFWLALSDWSHDFLANKSLLST